MIDISYFIKDVLITLLSAIILFLNLRIDNLNNDFYNIST